ncbi:hypothetical protein O181_002500 [Austropuccinia psidii MF-1]|uniref:Uncharacterized protein n=1 Tax=Austropuccinia psidii MF-1 TaxID=1389203 RepID=A0A9Q3BCK3_9BASI|nr:hypothetical protein [Austropuccinia psidii MF-1]
MDSILEYYPRCLIQNYSPLPEIPNRNSSTVETIIYATPYFPVTGSPAYLELTCFAIRYLESTCSAWPHHRLSAQYGWAWNRPKKNNLFLNMWSDTGWDRKYEQ